MIAYDVSALHVISLNSEQFSLTQAMAQVQDGHIFHISKLPTTPHLLQSARPRLLQPSSTRPSSTSPSHSSPSSTRQCLLQDHISQVHLLLQHLPPNHILQMHSLRFNWPFPVALHHLPSHHLPPHHLPFAACGCITTEMPPALFYPITAPS